MQATPAPSSPPRSPPPSNTTTKKGLPDPPPNTGTAPFSILTGLFEKLQNERKRDKKEKLINAWFTVRLNLYFQGDTDTAPALERTEGHGPLSSTPPHLAFRMTAALLFDCGTESDTERSRTCCLWFERAKPGQNLHQTHPSQSKGPRCHAASPLEEAHGQRCKHLK